MGLYKFSLASDFDTLDEHIDASKFVRFVRLHRRPTILQLPRVRELCSENLQFRHEHNWL